MKTIVLGLAALAALTAAPAADASYPGANGLLVFERPVGKQVDLFTVKPGGDGLRRLTRTPAWEERAEFSPDGQRLAFALSRPSGEPTEIATMRADGSERHTVTAYGSTSSSPTWGPDGRLAFFTLRDFPGFDGLPPAELYSIASDGTSPRRLTNDETIQTDPEWSPDGATIAYSAWQAVPGEPDVFDLGLYAINADGTGARAILDFSAKRDIASHDWSPDDKQLVLEIASAHPSGREPRSRQSDIAVVNADGTGLRYLTRTAALETNPVWSPDGRRIAFTGDRHLKRGRSERNGPAFELYTMRADGRDIRRLTHNDVPDLHPSWQPRQIG